MKAVNAALQGTQVASSSLLTDCLTDDSCWCTVQVTQLFSGYIGTMLQQYAQNPAQNWKAKDCALYLVMALTVKGKTAAQGATTTNEFVNIPDFFEQHIMPELQSANADERPVLKADTLKFLTTFRSKVPKAQCVAVQS